MPRNHAALAPEGTASSNPKLFKRYIIASNLQGIQEVIASNLQGTI